MIFRAIMHICIYEYVCVYMHAIILSEKYVMKLKERGEMYMRVFGGGILRKKHCNYIIISKI